MKYAIVTGASRGLGKESAMLALKEGYQLITLARKAELPTVHEEASAHQLTHTHLPTDLSDPESTISVGKKISQILEAESPEEVLLINNAGMVSPIGPVGSIDSDDISKHVALNTTAPMILLNELKKSSIEVPLTVVNTLRDLQNEVLMDGVLTDRQRRRSTYLHKRRLWKLRKSDEMKYMLPLVRGLWILTCNLRFVNQLVKALKTLRSLSNLNKKDSYEVRVKLLNCCSN